MRHLPGQQGHQFHGQSAVPFQRASSAPLGTEADVVTFDSRHQKNGLVLSVAGEVDMATADLFEEAVNHALITSPGGRVVLDLHALSFIDSSGLAVLIRTYKMARDQGTVLIIAAATNRIARTLSLVGLDRRVPLVATVDEALESAQAS